MNENYARVIYFGPKATTVLGYKKNEFYFCNKLSVLFSPEKGKIEQ